MSHNILPQDHLYMRHALHNGQRYLGQVWPNPAVGCVIVSPEGHIVTAGATQPSGRPHAERFALLRHPTGFSGGVAGCTAYVTLEPCAHTGKTPPCTQALIEAGISRVVIGHTDPDSRVAGRGVTQLQEAGIEVTTGVCAGEARALHGGFLSRLVRKRPWVTLKVATSLDGQIATRTGHSQWITGPESRRMVQRLRLRYDALVTGIGTVLADNPLMTCRLQGEENMGAVRVVLDTHLRLPITSKMVRSAYEVPLWVITAVADEKRLAPYTAAGVRLFTLPRTPQGSLSLSAVFHLLAEEGITRTLVEAGTGIVTACLQEKMADMVIWMQAPVLLGGDGRPCVGDLQLTKIDEAARHKILLQRHIGCDLMTAVQMETSFSFLSLESERATSYFL